MWVRGCRAARPAGALLPPSSGLLLTLPPAGAGGRSAARAAGGSGGGAGHGGAAARARCADRVSCCLPQCMRFRPGLPFLAACACCGSSVCPNPCRRLTRPAQLAGADPAAVQKVADLAQAPLEAILRNPHLTKASRTAALQQVRQGWQGSGRQRWVGGGQVQGLPHALLPTMPSPAAAAACDAAVPRRYCVPTTRPRPAPPTCRPRMPSWLGSRPQAPSVPNLRGCPAPAACLPLTWRPRSLPCCPPRCAAWRWRRAGAATGAAASTCGRFT